MDDNEQLILQLQCPDRSGIVAAVSHFFAQAGCNIVESAQHQEAAASRFFMRTALSTTKEKHVQELHDGFTDIASRYEMQWSLRSMARPIKAVLAVSKWGHCLDAILAMAKRGTLPIDVVAVVSNHADMQALSEWYEVPYFHLPVTPQSKPQQESEILAVMQRFEAELLVLARYMQILTNEMCRALEGRAINIHHSFLPGFKGAKPYHQAHQKGVKLIGATAHYVTADLDEGPIIEQDVVRVSHADRPSDLVETGRAVEAAVLCRAVKWHTEHRVLRAGERTVVFDR